MLWYSFICIGCNVVNWNLLLKSLQAEINALRKRLEQSDKDHVRGQEMIAKLNEHISQFQREVRTCQYFSRILV